MAGSVVANTFSRLVLVLIVTSYVASAAQSLEQAILARAVQAARKVSPEWTFIGAICNCPPLMDEEQGVAAGSWKLTDVASMIDVRVHTIATEEAATRFLSRQPRDAAPGWALVPYQAGDGATLGTAPDPRGFTQYAITMRRGRFLVFVSGRSKPTVERFANLLLEAVSN